MIKYFTNNNNTLFYLIFQVLFERWARILAVIGIIAEFNPLHTGHGRLIDEARASKKPVAAVLSGNFVQRGECAALEKEMQELEARRREEERYEQSQNAFGFNDKYVGGSEKSSDLEGALARFDFPTTWIVIALILFWPLGVFMGMTTTRWTLKGKTILAIIIGLFIILGLMVSALPS